MEAYMNEELKGVAIDKLTSIEKTLGLKGNNETPVADLSYIKLPINNDTNDDKEQIKQKLISTLNKIEADEKDEGFNLLSQLVLFGIQNGNIITENNISPNELASQSTISDNYHQHIRFGIQIYNHAKKNNYIKTEKTKTIKPYIPLNYTPCINKVKSYNRIIFGAPGTGKSFQLKQESTDGNHFANIERVTFHPDYSYGQFVGSYKPVSDDEGRIRYEYVPGPFMRTLVKALESGKNGDSAEKFLLIVEEINRAKVAAVFGDMFQLLDRTDAGDSVYEIQASEDVRRYLARELGGTKDNYTSIKLPNNMYIWATMNSADQGVFFMDTAFKRRWEFEYIGIDENEKEVKDYEIPVCKNDTVSKKIYWNELRKALNEKLISLGVNEDKLLGPFFLSKSILESAMSKGMDFVKLFESKVLMYLFEDAAKMKVRQLFNLDSGKYIYSEVCKKFEKDGLDVFNLESTVAHSDLQKGTQNE